MRGLETGLDGFSLPKGWKRLSHEKLIYNMRVPNPDRMVAIKQVGRVHSSAAGGGDAARQAAPAWRAAAPRARPAPASSWKPCGLHSNPQTLACCPPCSLPRHAGARGRRDPRCHPRVHQHRPVVPGTGGQAGRQGSRGAGQLPAPPRRRRRRRWRGAPATAAERCVCVCVRHSGSVTPPHPPRPCLFGAFLQLGELHQAEEWLKGKKLGDLSAGGGPSAGSPGHTRLGAASSTCAVERVACGAQRSALSLSGP